ncbi:MAG: hypothetical protein P4L93_06460 [Coriobacteriia bacterium]|nr:hypothetical protein [Coriobacteriia bacterium]
MARASDLPLGRDTEPTRRRVRFSDALWIVAAFVSWLVVLLWFPFLTHATLTRFSAGAFRLAVFEGAAIGVSIFLAVRFGGAPRFVWIGVAIPALLAIGILGVLLVAPDSPAQALGLGYYIYGILLPSAVCCVCSYLGAGLPRRTPDWGRDD